MPGSDMPSACLLTWNDKRWFAPLDEVRIAAADLIECALAAEMMMGLIRLGLPAQSVGGFVADIIRRTGRTMFGTPNT